MQVTAIFSSPRKKSNSTLLAQEIVRGAEEKGADVSVFDISRMTISPCLACYQCKKQAKGCVLMDDMAQIYTSLIDSSVWVFATPIYWFTISAQLKCVIDRLFALYNQDSSKTHFKKKKIVAAFSHGLEDALASGCANAIREFQDISAYTGCQFAGYVHGCGKIDEGLDPSAEGYLPPGDVQEDRGLMEKAYSLGRALF